MPNEIVAVLDEPPAIQNSPDTVEKHRIDLQHVLDELKIPLLEIPPDYLHQLVAIIDKNLDAFPFNDDDFGCSDQTEHTIDTGTNPEFREKYRPMIFAAREFVEKEFEKYLRLCVLSRADPGQYPMLLHCSFAEEG